MVNDIEPKTLKRLHFGAPNCTLIRKQIASVKDFLAEFEGLYTKPDDIFWFRGHADFTWDVCPSALRFEHEDERTRALASLVEFRRLHEYRFAKCPPREDRFGWMQLWARGLVTHFAIGLGSTYTYHIPGGYFGNTPNARIAIPCLRRWVGIDVQLRVWLETARDVLPVGSPERMEMENILAAFLSLNTYEAGKRQVAREYKEWLIKIASVPTTGRAVALFQDLTSAFVTGRSLADFPPSEGAARRPERVAQQLMVNCI